jgi:hypothetical protein
MEMLYGLVVLGIAMIIASLSASELINSLTRKVLGRANTIVMNAVFAISGLTVVGAFIYMASKCMCNL